MHRSVKADVFNKRQIYRVLLNVPRRKCLAALKGKKKENDEFEEEQNAQ